MELFCCLVGVGVGVGIIGGACAVVVPVASNYPSTLYAFRGFFKIEAPHSE